MTSYKVTANGVEMGIFRAETQADALDVYARDAGYRSYSDLVMSLCGDDWPDRDDQERQARIEKIESQCHVEEVSP